MCSAWTGYHIHQYASSPFARNTSTYPYAYPPEHPMYSVDVTAPSAYQNYVSFQY